MKDGILEAFGGSFYGQSGSSKSTPGWPVFVTAYLGLLLLVSLPILQTQFAPLIDYPNHFARTYILANHDSADLSTYYLVHWGALPNLAMDTVVTFLENWVSVSTAGNIFLLMILLLTSSGAVALSFVLHRRIPWISLIVFYFLYNSVFLWGFVNFSFSIGVFLWVFAAWIRTDSSPSWLRLLVFAALSLLLFFCHLFGFGIYVVVIAGFECGKYFNGHYKGLPEALAGWAFASAQFIPAALTFLFLSPTSGAAGTAVTYGSLEIRVAALVTFIRNYIVSLDLVTLIILGVLIAVGLDDP